MAEEPKEEGIIQPVIEFFLGSDEPKVQPQPPPSNGVAPPTRRRPPPTRPYDMSHTLAEAQS